MNVAKWRLLPVLTDNEVSVRPIEVFAFLGVAMVASPEML